MRLFKCSCCEQVLYFENTECLRCGSRLGFFPDTLTLEAVVGEGEAWRPVAGTGTHRFCANAVHSACNWMVPAGDAQPYCRACRHNRTIPDLDDAGRLDAWRRIEVAKRRLFYTLLRLRLPTPAPDSGDPQPLSFDFLADAGPEGGPKVMTGHDNGHITLALSEADDAHRERMRVQLGEPYRTLLGHFRHEIGHYYWDKLVRDAGEAELARCRALFGDDRRDYGEALAAHYANGAPDDWQTHYVSSYATMHPWEDWAETWAHYLHMVDTLEMASAFGIRVAPEFTEDVAMDAGVDLDPMRAADVRVLVEAWLPLTYAVNSLNRAMGQADLYPFVIPPAVVEKMAYIHDLIRRRGSAGRVASTA